MIKIENVDVYGWEAAIRGMRNPMNSWNKSDSQFCHDDGEYHTIQGNTGPTMEDTGAIVIGDNDLNLMKSLAAGGPVHAKYRRMITVSMDITTPLYWWKEFDAYRIGVTPNPTDIEYNSCSTMHKICAKEFTLEDFSCEQLIDNFYTDIDFEYSYNMSTSLVDEMYTLGSRVMIANTPLQLLANTILVLNACRKKYLETNDKRYWWQMIQLLPSSYNQKRTVMLNYEVLAGIYPMRKNHKLDEWREFCKWIERLPCFEGVIKCGSQE